MARVDEVCPMLPPQLIVAGIIAVASALLFLACRWIVITGFGFLANPWLAAAVGALVASAVASPVLWRAMKGSMTQKVTQD